jgi:hypothetical protein
MRIPPDSSAESQGSPEATTPQLVPDDNPHVAKRRELPTPQGNRYLVTVGLKQEEFELISERAEFANMPRSHYVRDATLAYHILRGVSPADVLPLTTQAIKSVRTLAKHTMDSAHPATARHVAAAMAELERAARDLERNATLIAAILSIAPPVRLA